METEKGLNMKQSIISRILILKIVILLLCGLMVVPIMAQGYKSNKNKNMKTLTVYFSLTAGNTKRIAEKVHAAIGGDLVRLEPVTPYPANYSQVVNQGEDEVNRGYKPELKPLNVDWETYDRIIVGTPTWWYKMSPVVFSFLSNNDFTGKTMIPFMTNAGWPGTVIKDMSDLAKKKGARVENGHEFRFSSDERHFDRMETPEKELDAWIESLK